MLRRFVVCALVASLASPAWADQRDRLIPAVPHLVSMYDKGGELATELTDVQLNLEARKGREVAVTARGWYHNHTEDNIDRVPAQWWAHIVDKHGKELWVFPFSTNRDHCSRKNGKAAFEAFESGEKLSEFQDHLWADADHAIIYPDYINVHEGEC